MVRMMLAFAGKGRLKHWDLRVYKTSTVKKELGTIPVAEKYTFTWIFSLYFTTYKLFTLKNRISPLKPICPLGSTLYEWLIAEREGNGNYKTKLWSWKASRWKLIPLCRLEIETLQDSFLDWIVFSFFSQNIVGENLTYLLYSLLQVLFFFSHMSFGTFWNKDH